MFRHFLAIAAICAVAFANRAHAAVPSQLTVQGKLTDASGNPLPAGSKTFTFRIFNAQSAGTELWPGGLGEVQVLSTDAAGLWSANVGSQIALTTAVFSGTEAWLQITVDDGQASTDLPRTQLVTSPYAHRVATIDGATGGRLIDGGIDLPYLGSSLNNNASGIRWQSGDDSATAFGLSVAYGLWFQPSWDLANPFFGVRAPTVDGSLGQELFSVDAFGLVKAHWVLMDDGIPGESAAQLIFENGGDLAWYGSAGGFPRAVLSLHTDDNVYLDAIAANSSSLIFRNTQSLFERMRIDPNGFVGIGTSSPAQPLDVAGRMRARGFFCDDAIPGGDGAYFVFENGGDLRWYNSAGDLPRSVLSLHTDDNVYLDASVTNSSSLIFRNSLSLAERMRIDPNGFVGVGTSAPGRVLQIGDESAVGSEAIIRLESRSGAGGNEHRNWEIGVPQTGATVTGSGYDFVIDDVELGTSPEAVFQWGSGYLGLGVLGPTYRIALPDIASPAGQGVADAWLTWSSRRWKTDIRPLEDALEKVVRLRGVQFRSRDGGNEEIGLIAEEVGEVVPEVVSYEANGVDANAVDYARLVALLVEGMKEQQKRIEKQDERIEELEARMRQVAP